MSRTLMFFVFLKLVLYSAVPALCQEFPMLHYTMEEGLPSNNVYSVYRDSRGFLWMATDKGVARYNGVRFETFTTFDGLADNEVFFFQEDYEGRLWLGTFNGDLCYFKDGLFHNKATDSFLRLGKRYPHIYSIYLNKDSSININFYDRNVLLNVNKKRTTFLYLKNIEQQYKSGQIFNKRRISSNEYELTCSHADIIIDSNGNGLKVIKDRDRPILGPGFYRYQNTHSYITEDFVYSEDKKIIKLLKKGFYKKNVINSCFDDSVNFFFCTTNGLFINDTIQILRENIVTSVTKDINGNFWISTSNNGVYCLKNDFLKTRIYKNAYEGVVKYCYEDVDNLFYAVSNNNLFSFRNGAIRCLFDYKKFTKINYTSLHAGGYLIEKNGSDYSYFNTYDEDNIIIDQLNSKKPDIYRRHNKFLHITIKAILSTRDVIYIKGREKIVSIAKSEKRKSNYTERQYIPDSADGGRIFGTAVAQDSVLIYSSISNVYKIHNGIQVKEQRFNNLAFKTMGIFDKYFLGITHNNMLVVCNNFNENISIDTITNENCVWQRLHKLDDRHILISTNNLYRILTLTPSAGKRGYSISAVETPFIPLDAEDICSDGTNCHFFKNGAITSITIQDLLIRSEPPQLFFTFIKTAKKDIRIKSEIELPYRESKNITVSFLTCSFIGKNVDYKYSVSKTDQDNWINLKGEEINLVNPGYGTYTIKVKAKTKSSEDSAPIVFTLDILRPWWATWWFIALCICAAMAITGLAIRLRILFLVRKNKKEHDTEMKFVKSEYKALNALMNPHFIFNTLNNVQSLFNGNDKLAANEYLRIFADLIRQNMYNVSKELIPLQKEIALVMNYLMLEKLRFEDKLNYIINVDENIDLSDIMVPPLLIQPLVENSIKHGILPLKDREGVIHINVYERGETLYIEIKDNGVGIVHSKESPDVLHESFGMDNIKKRIDQLSIIQNKKITFHISEEHDDAGKHLWTVVTISMPVSE